MKALVLNGTGEQPQMSVLNRPESSEQPGHTLVRVKTATINQLSNFIRTGLFPNVPLPLVLGNEGAGVVVQSEVFEKGASVVVYGGNKLGVSQDGLFQEWLWVENHRLLALPKSLSYEEGAALSVNYLTAYRALTKAVTVKPGDYVLVSGAAGNVGYATVQAAKALGARPIGLSSSAQRASIASEAGAIATINLSVENDVPAAVRALTGGAGANFAIDPVGGEGFTDLVRSLRPNGTLVSVGFTGGKQPLLDVVDIIVGEKRVVGYSLHAEKDEELHDAIKEILRMAAEGAVKPRIDSRVTLDDYLIGYERLTSRQAAGAIILTL
ncbi:quinone oxidoreductase family protein [Pseudomonas eucalypticola]|uniref:Zinc-binding alcohol dehydrogenase family protein n=1 Tax=Pseudomonas eucalypticola TaxID=2599595 RepID=A0A7D5D7P7_9PSED|nr:zinc-binding alcohol dehydrogenase family protein [Pseudomonas eucalypticola]QKZ04235.1 zinc-binding alcohol dehydrogenase family protein [Pseudomonas eucalypticola]